MNDFISIGQMSKINNVSIQALRHYEKLGILSPSYINPNTGYRYYSIEDFVKIGLIKQCKSLGLSLDEIKEVIYNYTSLDSIYKILENQKFLLSNKIKEFELAYNKITTLENEIGISLNKGLNNIFTKYNGERTCLEFNYSDRYSKQFELDLRKYLIIAEEVYENANTEIVFTVSSNKMISTKEIEYVNVMLILGENKHYKGENITSIPKGNYLTMYFDDVYRNSKKYYKIFVDYIKENHLKTKGDFREIYILTRIGNDGLIKSLGKLEILLE